MVRPPQKTHGPQSLSGPGAVTSPRVGLRFMDLLEDIVVRPGQPEKSRVVLLGARRAAKKLIRALRDKPWSGLPIVGFVDAGHPRSSSLGLRSRHPLHDAAHALRGSVDAKPDALEVRTGLRDLLDALKDLLVLVESDAEIGVQTLIDVGVTKREIADMQPMVDAAVIIDRRDEMAGEDAKTRVAVFGIGGQDRSEMVDGGSFAPAKRQAATELFEGGMIGRAFSQ